MTRGNNLVGLQRRGASAVLLLIAGTLLFASAIFYSLPSNVLADRGTLSASRALSVAWSPQGWGFFTRPPSDPGIRVFDAKSLDSLMLTPQNLPANLLGLSRTQRAQGPELAGLAQNVDLTEWFECPLGSGLSECVAAARGAAGKVDQIKVRNTSPITTVCGEVLLVETIPVQWSYRELYDEFYTPNRILEMDVSC